MQGAGEGKPPDGSSVKRGQGIEQPFGHRQVPEGLFCF